MNVVAAGALDPFPGGTGSYWIYEGVVRYQNFHSTAAKQKEVRWRMSIERVLRRDGATAVIVRGFPSDLDWSNGNASNTESMFVRTDDGSVYRISSEHGIPDKKFADTGVTIQELLDGGQLWCQRQPIEGAQPGGGNCPERTDQMYCWVLGAPREVSLLDIKGIKPGFYTAYFLLYGTNPDETRVEIVSGVGVAGYEYHHHGTIADTDLRLVEVHLAEEK